MKLNCRMPLMFSGITLHCAGNKNKRKYKIIDSFFHVPTFILISFNYLL